jgi:GTPase SAR1 family protein
MFSSWAYVLIGDNNTGKTSFQRYLVEALCQEKYIRLPRNVIKEIVHPRAPKKLKTLFTANRSYQEKQSEYLSPKNYINSFFKDADICILSSHSHGTSIQDVQVMIDELVQRAYNVAGVFWSNDFGSAAQNISLLAWQERLWIENPYLEDADEISSQIKNQAYEFAEILLARAYAQ